MSMYDRIFSYYPFPIEDNSVLIGREFQTQSLGGCGDLYRIDNKGKFEWHYHTDPCGQNNRLVWIHLPFDGEIVFYTQVPVHGTWKSNWFEFKASFHRGMITSIEPSTLVFQWEFGR